MHPQLFVLIVQPDLDIGCTLASAILAAGHDADVVAAACWAVALVRENPPDVILLEQRAAGYERLLDTLDGLGVHVPVLVTRFSSVPPAYRRIEPPVLAALVRRAEAAAEQGF